MYLWSQTGPRNREFLAKRASLHLLFGSIAFRSFWNSENVAEETSSHTATSPSPGCIQLCLFVTISFKCACKQLLLETSLLCVLKQVKGRISEIMLFGSVNFEISARLVMSLEVILFIYKFSF